MFFVLCVCSREFVVLCQIVLFETSLYSQFRVRTAGMRRSLDVCGSVFKFDKTLKMSVEPAHLRSNPPASAGPARPHKLARPPSPPGLPLTSLAGPRSILIAALITISAMRAHSISQSYFIVPRRSLKMLRGSRRSFRL